jgi:hypothetical protein
VNKNVPNLQKAAIFITPLVSRQWIYPSQINPFDTLITSAFMIIISSYYLVLEWRMPFSWMLRSVAFVRTDIS